MFTQRTSHLRGYLWTTDEILSKGDWYCCWHRVTFYANWATTERKRCHKIPVTERYQFASNTNQYITYRFTRVPFGITSSLFLLGATIKHHQGNGNGTDECNIHRDIYVDNLIIISVDVSVLAVVFYQQISKNQHFFLKLLVFKNLLAKQNS